MKRRRPENPLKLIVWSHGRIESFCGSMEDAMKYVKSKECDGWRCLKIL